MMKKNKAGKGGIANKKKEISLAEKVIFEQTLLAPS